MSSPSPAGTGSRNSVPLAQHQQGIQSFCGSVQSRPELSPAQALLWAVLRAALPCCAQAPWLLWGEDTREWANEWVNACYRVEPSLNSDYIASDLGKGQLPFKLTNLFPNPLWTCAGPFLYPASFLDFPGFRALIPPDPLPGLGSLPLWGSPWLLLRMRLAKAFAAVFTSPSVSCHRTGDGFFLPHWGLGPLSGRCGCPLGAYECCGFQVNEA